MPARITMRVTERLGRESRWIGDEYTNREARPQSHPKRAKPEARIGMVCGGCGLTRSTSGRCDCNEDGDRFTVKPVVRGTSAPGTAVKAGAGTDVVRGLAKALSLSKGEAETLCSALGIRTFSDVTAAVKTRYDEILNVLYKMRTTGL